MLEFQLTLSEYLAQKAKECAIKHGMWYAGPRAISKGTYTFLISGRPNLERIMGYLKQVKDEHPEIRGQILTFTTDGTNLHHLQQNYLTQNNIIQTCFADPIPFSKKT